MFACHASSGRTPVPKHSWSQDRIPALEIGLTISSTEPFSLKGKSKNEETHFMNAMEGLLYKEQLPIMAYGNSHEILSRLRMATRTSEFIFTQ
jgi:hypothetical protein